MVKISVTSFDVSRDTFKNFLSSINKRAALVIRNGSLSENVKFHFLDDNHDMVIVFYENVSRDGFIGLSPRLKSNIKSKSRSKIFEEMIIKNHDMFGVLGVTIPIPTFENWFLEKDSIRKIIHQC